MFVDQQLEMRGQLLVELAVQPGARDESADARDDRVHEALHWLDLPSASTRPITAASRSQFSVSATSCFSPALVML